MPAMLVKVESLALVTKVVCGPALGAEGAVLGAPPMRPCSNPPSPPLAVDSGAVPFGAPELELDACWHVLVPCKFGRYWCWSEGCEQGSSPLHEGGKT